MSPKRYDLICRKMDLEWELLRAKVVVMQALPAYPSGRHPTDDELVRAEL